MPLIGTQTIKNQPIQRVWSLWNKLDFQLELMGTDYSERTSTNQRTRGDTNIYRINCLWINKKQNIQPKQNVKSNKMGDLSLLVFLIFLGA